jgi:hypothetical protein
MVQEAVDKSNAITKRDHLAFMIAESFNDLGQVKLYINYCKKYPLNIIYRAFSEARNFPEEKIKKSRAAIFFYLIKTYVHRPNQNSSH